MGSREGPAPAAPVDRGNGLLGVMGEEDAVAEADLADPNPDVGDLFRHYDGLYFQGALAAAGFTVQWRSLSSPPSRSFGSCTFSKPQNTITLSESVLKYRSCTDRKNALLHEMIHAIIYVKHHRKDRNNHGPAFRAWMEAINSCCVQDRQRPDGGYNITTRHDFLPEEPHSFKGTVCTWECTSCGDALLRAMNQGPPSDACCIENVSASCGNMLCYWHNHKNECPDGTYKKMMLKVEAPSQKKAAGGAQLRLTLPSEMSKSKGAIQESSSSILQLPWTKSTKPNTEDKHLCLGSGSKGKPQGSGSLKAYKRRRPEMVGETSAMPAAPQENCQAGEWHELQIAQKACSQLASPHKRLKQDLDAQEKKEPSPLMGSSIEKLLDRSSSKKAYRQHRPRDTQETTVLPTASGIKPTASVFVASEKQRKGGMPAVPQGNCQAGEWHELQIAQKTCSQPVSPQKRLKQDPDAPEKKELPPLMGSSNEKLLDRSSSKKAYRQHRPRDTQETTVLPTAARIKPMASAFVASEKQRKGKCRRKPVKKKEYAVMSAWLNFYESDRSSGSPEPLVNKRTERRRRERERAKTQQSQPPSPCSTLTSW